MPCIIPYPTVLESLEASGLRCVYPNSGAFGLKPEPAAHILGWIAAEDPTIRAEARATTRIVKSPAAQSLAAMLGRAWKEHFPGPLWLMPASHWAYELQFGGADWLPSLLQAHGIDSESLRACANGSAIQFDLGEADSLVSLVGTLFTRLLASDFTIAFPHRNVVAMLHHHQQIWWQTSERPIWDSLGTIKED